jgi:hypothetical protein
VNSSLQCELQMMEDHQKGTRRTHGKTVLVRKRRPLVRTMNTSILPDTCDV